MKKVLIVASIALLGLVGCKPTSSSSSEQGSSSSSQEIIVNPKDEILDICDELIENNEDKNLVSSTQTLNGFIELLNTDSTTSIAYSNKLSMTNLVVNTSSEYIENTDSSKGLYDIKGDISIDHKEQYFGIEDGIETENFLEKYSLNEKMMFIDDSIYVDLSEEAASLFTEEQILISPDLKLKQENFSVIIDELMEEYMPDFDSSNTEIPEIDPHEILEEFVGEDSLFNEYLKYVKEDDVLKLKLTLKPADFNELLNDLVLEYDPESTVPVSTIINMQSNNTSKFEIVFNFENRDIASMDINVNGRFSLLADSYTMNVNLQGSIVNNEITSFVGLDGYENFIDCEDAHINVKEELKETLDKFIPIIEEENSPNE